MSKTLALKLFLVSDPRLLCVVRATVGEMAVCAGFAEGDVRLIVLAVDEAITNIIRHAYGGQFDQPITLSFHQRSMKSAGGRDAFEIRLVDQGIPVDPKKLRGRALEDVRPGGLGLHFIRETMDKVVFRHIGGRNRLRLVKFLTPTSEPGNTGEAECR